MSNKEASCARCEQVMMWGGGGRSWPGRMDCWVWVRAPAVNTEIGGQHYSKQIPTLTAAGQDRAGSHEGLVLIDKKYYSFAPCAVLELGAGQQAPPRLHPAAGGDTERVRGAAECSGSAACDGRLRNGD